MSWGVVMPRRVFVRRAMWELEVLKLNIPGMGVNAGFAGFYLQGCIIWLLFEAGALSVLTF